MVKEEHHNPPANSKSMNAEPLTSSSTATPLENNPSAPTSPIDTTEIDESIIASAANNSNETTTRKEFYSPPISSLQPLDSKQQINLTQKGDFVYIALPLTIHTENNQWQRILDDFRTRLHKIEKSWLPATKVHLQSQDRLLDSRQIQDLTDILAQVQLKLDLVITKRRQTAVAAASAGYSVQQESVDLPLSKTNAQLTQELAEPLYLKNTIRSGEEICHPSSIIIFGDVNPGANIIAYGDIFVWGTLKGVAHAGAMGNRQALIMALRMEPTQIRIADLVARAPDYPPENHIPEVAYISWQGIRIRGANTFTKTHIFLPERQYWVNQREGRNYNFS
jgi:septum site-determining protein MinC